jgi:hypothetical protein
MQLCHIGQMGSEPRDAVLKKNGVSRCMAPSFVVFFLKTASFIAKYYVNSSLGTSRRILSR